MGGGGFEKCFKECAGKEQKIVLLFTGHLLWGASLGSLCMGTYVSFISMLLFTVGEAREDSMVERSTIGKGEGQICLRAREKRDRKL